MAIGSKKGACSSNTKSAKGNCLQHNRRDYAEGKLPGYINPHLSHLNRTVFEDTAIKDRKYIGPLVERALKLYTAMTGQKAQKSMAPFKEAALRISPNVTDSQLMDFKAKVEDMTGWKCVGIWVHLDEGFPKSKYIEGDTGFAINYHAHVLFDTQDHEEGTIKRVDRKKLSRMQDLLADSTGMERGNKAEETGIKHKNTQEERIFAAEQRIIAANEIARQAEEKAAEAKEMPFMTAFKVNALDRIQDSEQYKGLQAENQRLASDLENARAERDKAVQERKDMEQGNRYFARRIDELTAELQGEQASNTELREQYKQDRTWLEAWTGIRMLARGSNDAAFKIGKGIRQAAEWFSCKFRAAADILMRMCSGIRIEDEERIRPTMYRIADDEELKYRREQEQERNFGRGM